MRLKYLLVSGMLGFSVVLASAQTSCVTLVSDHVDKLRQDLKANAAPGAFNGFTNGQDYLNALDADTATDGVVRPPAVAAGLSVLINDLNWNDTPCLVQLIILSTAQNAPPLEKITQDLKAVFQQNGSSSGTDGSTNLVSKGTTAKILAIAQQFGALTESTNGSTATVQGSLGAVPTALFNMGIAAICTGANQSCIKSSTVNALNRFSYSVGFDTSQNSQSVSGTATSSTSANTAQQATFAANIHTLNSVAGKFVMIPGPAADGTSVSSAISKLKSTDPPSKQDATVIAAHELLLKHCPQLDPQNFPKKVTDLTADNRWTYDTMRMLLEQEPTSEEFTNTWNTRGKSLILFLERNSTCKKQYLSDSQSVATKLNTYVASLNAFFEGLRATPVLSIEYNFNNPVSQPTNSTIRLIGQLSKNGFTGTLNAAGSFYNSTPSTSVPGASRVRDFQIAGEGSYSFGKTRTSGQKTNPFLGTSTTSMAYYYQDQTSPAILNVTPGEPVTGVTFTGLPSTATQVFAQKGVIHVAQAKFTWIPSNWNINFPVSVTWSNRTELVTSPVWRGQLGISYDFDSLFSKN